MENNETKEFEVSMTRTVEETIKVRIQATSQKEAEEIAAKRDENGEFDWDNDVEDVDLIDVNYCVLPPIGPQQT